ncbi:VRR-NUC domain-containing protein [Mycena olivaceomarginata]|nr:VRR-NUC domain-containing protein [Mycena olivaceomarginata]
MNSRNIRDIIFGIDDTAASDLEEEQEPEPASLYVTVPERAINNVCDHERHLLTEDEWDFIKKLRSMEYHSRFILFRILLRKSGKWFRVHDLHKYVSEVGDEGLLDAMGQLASPLNPPMAVDHEIIDLTGDSDDEDAQPVAGPSNLRPQVPAEEDDVQLDFFCQGEDKLPLLEGLRILNVGEIKSLCKTLKIQIPKMTKDQMITTLMAHTSTQSTINFQPSPKGKGKGKAETGLRQTTLSFTPKITKDQTSILRQLMLKKIGKSVKVNSYFHKLMVRLHIIWFRSIELPDSLFRPALFAGFKKLTFARYEHVRDPDIWRTRELYLDYETGLQVEAVIDELLKSDPKGKRGRATTIPLPDIGKRFVTPGTPGLDALRAVTDPAPAPTPGAQADADAEEPATVQNARVVKRILEEHVWPKWRALVAAESEPARERKPGLERFEAGFLYTRILRKCGQALATLKEFAAEKDQLDALLGQRLWRRGRRGGWYDRRALLQMNYLYKKRPAVLWDARAGIIEALGDADTAIVARPGLIRRLDRVEKMLKLSPEQKAKHADCILKEPDEVSFVAIRVWDHPDSIKIDWAGKLKGKENKTADGTSITNYFGVPDAAASEAEPKKSQRWTGKSLWQGVDGTVNVETRALQYYDKEHGLKGFHSETQILTTLFGLLFWDIIFAQVPGAFETPFQFGPLDIGEDSFYYARRERMEERLREILDGQAPTILAANDERYREDNTCCIGVSWDVCGREDLLEIVECLGGGALAAICRLFCEDYHGRCSGGPDLIVWNPETKECRFVEVKGPGDTLQENQKLWSDALLSAGCAVEVCHVVDSKAKKKVKVKKEKETPKPAEKKSKNATASTSRAAQGKGKGKGKGRARASSVKPGSDAEEEGELPSIIDLVDGDDDAAWTPSTEIRDLPPRQSKRRHPGDDDELPVFAAELELEHAGPSSLKRRKTI